MKPVKAKILVVDDLPEKILVYRAILDELGEEIVTARSGEEALKQVLQQEFAVILLDVNMPGLDGFETAALIRKRKRSAHTPIIFVTAFADEIRAREGYAHGAVDFILAPVVPEILRAKVRVFVELFRMTETVRRHMEERIALAEERTRREAAEEANRRLSFLTYAKSVIGRTLDPQETARDILRVVVPRLAGRALLAQMDEQLENCRVLDAQLKDGELAIEGRSTLEDVPLSWRQTIEQVVRSAGPHESMGRSPPGEPQTLILPLRGRERVSGVLVLADPAGDQAWSGPDLTMAEALASRCGIAIDNARLHAEVQHADRQKDEFLSMLAHELRNPLAPIRSAVDVLRLRDQDQPDVAWARDIIDRQVVHLVRLVDDLLDVSRITRGKIRLNREPLTVQDIVSAAIETSRPLIEAHGHKLRVLLPNRRLELDGDRTRLAQVLTNLLNNAAKYTAAGGSITLDIQADGGEAVIRVRDTGMGIPREMLAKIFDLFTQVDRSIDRSQGGLGVGLTLVRKLVELHGGAVRVTSEGLGKGAEFIVRLPLRPAGTPGQGAVNPPALSPAVAERLRVLIVDDNNDAADSLARFFRHSGHETRVVYDGLDAIAAAGEFSPHAVVLDLGLPGIDGFAVARELRRQPVMSRAALVAVSGYGHEDFVRRSQEAGFDGHFAKPVDATQLLNELVRLTLVAGPLLDVPDPVRVPASST
ncbi:MAG TPA: response regulator [Pirellulaceae bacterium]|nr:response regulator [Pirellulaceae bacterium]